MRRHQTVSSRQIELTLLTGVRGFNKVAVDTIFDVLEIIFEENQITIFMMSFSMN
jgi:hypothetical protein